MKVKNLNIYSGSMMETDHIGCGWKVRGPRTKFYLKYVQKLIKLFNDVRVEHILRDHNQLLWQNWIRR